MQQAPTTTTTSTSVTPAPSPPAARIPPTVTDAAGTPFRDHLASAIPSPPPRVPVKGDIDGNGTVSQIEKAVQKIRDMIKNLQSLLIMLALRGELTETQRQRINTAMTRLSNLANDAEAAIKAGDPPDEKQLLKIASEIMMEAMKTDAQEPGDAPDGHLPSPELKRAWREQRDRFDAATAA